MSDTEEHPADVASYMAACAKRRLLEVDGLERGGAHEDAFKVLRRAEYELTRALHYIAMAKETLSMDHGFDDADYALTAGVVLAQAEPMLQAAE